LGKFFSLCGLCKDFFERRKIWVQRPGIMFPAMHKYQDNGSLPADSIKFDNQGLHLAWFVDTALIIKFDDDTGVAVLVHNRFAGLTSVVRSDADPPPWLGLADGRGLRGHDDRSTRTEKDVAEVSRVLQQMRLPPYRLPRPRSSLRSSKSLCNR
jgi:hypothetical protein